MYKYTDTVLFYFAQAKKKIQKAASKILQSICLCSHQRYGELTTHEMVNTYVPKTVIIIIFENSAAVKKSCFSIKRIHSH